MRRGPSSSASVSSSSTLTSTYAPGTGAAVSGGLTPWQVMDALFDLGRRDQVVGFDLVEVDPTRDPQGITQRLANKLLLTFLAGFRHRRDRG